MVLNFYGSPGLTENDIVFRGKLVNPSGGNLNLLNTRVDIIFPG